MSTRPKLSILTPAIPERAAQLAALLAKIDAHRAGREADVEHIALIDSRGARSVGTKRDELVRLARGEYLAFVDDDDDVEPGYVEHLLAAIAKGPDCVTFLQRAIWNGHESTVSFRLGAVNGPFTPGGTTQRNAWHVCAFRANLAKRHHFPDTNYGEDWAWARHVSADAQTEVHIPLILHTYRHDQATTAAPPPPAPQS
jgi:hypothetical protein